MTHDFDVRLHDASPAGVIRPVRPAMSGAVPGHVGHRVADPELEPAQVVIDRDIDLLRGRYGERWVELPATLGRSAAEAGRLLADGPTAIDLGVGAPSTTVRAARELVLKALSLADLVADEGELLAAALGAVLADLPLRELDSVVGAVLHLGLVEPADAAWATPSAAHAAQIVIEALGAELRHTTGIHEALYAAFTDDVLAIPETRLRSGGQPWRLVSRRRLRGDLAACSRTGRPPGSVRAAAEQVLAARRGRQRLADLAPILTTHFGSVRWGPLTDVDTVAASVAAVRRFQESMGARLDHDRLAGLLAAGAFRDAVVAAPANSLHTALAAWRVDVTSACAGDPWALPADALAEWSVRTAAGLPALTDGDAAMAALGRPPSTVQSLIDDLLLREHVAELSDWLHAQRALPASSLTEGITS